MAHPFAYPTAISPGSGNEPMDRALRQNHLFIRLTGNVSRRNGVGALRYVLSMLLPYEFRATHCSVASRVLCGAPNVS